MSNGQKDTEITALSQQLMTSYEELSLVYKLSQQLKLTDNLEPFFRSCHEDLRELIGADTLTLFMKNPPSGHDSFLISGNMELSHEEVVSISRYLLTRLESTSRPIILSDVSAHPSLVKILKTTTPVILSWPILSDDEPTGLLTAISNSRSDVFDTSDAHLLSTVARHISSFLENRSLLNDIEELLIGLLTILVNTIDAKDTYTRGHSQRVAIIAQTIALSLGLEKDESEKVYFAGLLHDIGKIGIDEVILRKPGKLTEKEFATIKKHTIIGSKIISSLKQFRLIIPGILYHHERYDGGGYPEGLKEQQIPLMGMIVGLADCFDAITSDRTYRKAMEFEEAIDTIKGCSGTQFSPILVNGFLECDFGNLMMELSQEHIGKEKLPELHWLTIHNH